MTHLLTLRKERLASMICNGARLKEVNQHPHLLDHVVAEIIIRDDNDLQEVLFSDDHFVINETLKKMRA
jgi:hypothetical protein